MKKLLAMKPQEQYCEMLKDMGFKKSEMTNAAVISAAVFSKAAKGEITAVKSLCELAGENAADDKSGVSPELSKLYKALEKDENDS